MSDRTNVGIIFGGQSAEHEVSLQSAKNVLAAIDRERFTVVPIGIDKSGSWWQFAADDCFLNPDDPATITLKTDAATPLPLSALEPNAGTSRLIDLAFPLIHGPFGEDGRLQGLLEMLNIPYVGADVLGSAVGMDKDVMKRLLRDAGIPIAKFLTLRQHERIDPEMIAADLGLPCFVKPANLGSSVGVSKAHNETELADALAAAFTHDRKVLVEEAISGRELECSVLGNESPEASIVGEILPSHEFYSYEAKYLDEHGAALAIPAELPADLADRARELALLTYRTLECHDLARVDMFLNEEGALIMNEINTLPGFTSVSMYPQLWEASGLPYQALVTRLLELAQERSSRI